MKTSLFTLGAVGLLAAGVAIHHSGHCPLMDARHALVHHGTGSPASSASARLAGSAGSATSAGSWTSAARAVSTVSAAKPDDVVATMAKDADR